MRRTCTAVTLFCLLGLTVPIPSALAQTPVAAATSAKTWAERRSEIEEYLKTAKIVKIDDVSVGVTHPRRARFAPGGPVESMAWKALKPGRYQGFWESYTSEIAAYEIDKLLDLGMVPPVVERRVDNDLGAAIMWVSPTKSFKELGGLPTPPPAQQDAWTRQLVKAKMFDDLIGNIDPNLGNWLVDPAWNIILIDHSRALTTEKKLTHELTHIDADLWSRMNALDEAGLTAALGKWLGKSEIRALLQRRDQMRTVTRKLVATRGEGAVFVR